MTGSKATDDEKEGTAPRTDRRRRRADDPTMAVQVTLPITMKKALDCAALSRQWTRSAVIRAALAEWLAREKGPLAAIGVIALWGLDHPLLGPLGEWMAPIAQMCLCLGY